MNTLQRLAVGTIAVSALVVPAVILSSPPPAPSIRECPHNAFFADTSLHDSVLSVPARITNVPEYHDCQRFIFLDKHGTKTYGALQAIYVRFDLNGLFDSIDPIGAKRAPGTPTLEKPTRGPRGDTLREIVGEIRSEGRYGPLGLDGSNSQLQYSCIVFEWVTTGGPKSYRAWIVGASKETDCKPIEGRVPDVSGGKGLFVTLVAPASRSAPALSRWEWDNAASEQYIGMTCPAGWCELHPRKAKVVPSTDRVQSSQFVSLVNPTRFEGSWDWQYLADSTLKEKKKWFTPSGVWGAVMPDPRLASYNSATYDGGRWVPVAMVAMAKELNWYREHLGFMRAWPAPTSELHLNQVALCRIDHPGDCAPADTMSCSDDMGAPSNWRTQVSAWGPAGGAPVKKYLCADFHQTTAIVNGVLVKVPPPRGVVRWRWLPNDETMWISCPSGCCQAKVQ